MDSKDLKRYKAKSIDTAIEMKLFDDRIYERLGKSLIVLKHEKMPSNIEYGQANYEKNIVSVYSENVSDHISDIGHVLEYMGVSREDKCFCKNCISEMGEEKFREIFNQSGMDHELIGHIGNHAAGKSHGEYSACKTQFSMAEQRAKDDADWSAGAEMMSKILPHHKKIPEIFSD